MANIFFATCFSSIQHDGALVFDDSYFILNDCRDITRGLLQLTDANSTFTVDGVLLFDSNANVLCGSLIVNNVNLLYDTAAYHADPTVTPLFQSDPQHKNAMMLQNRTASFFISKWYSVQRLIDGTSNAWTFNNHCVYHKGNTGVSGFVRLGGGFTILPDASSVFETFISANGSIDLRDTGTLVLGGALGFGSSVTMSSGGNIDGHGNQLVLGGNLTLPANKSFHLMSDTVINGLGNTLTIGDYGQLFVDNNMTLTLQNMTLVSGAKTSVFPPIRCAGSGSKLVLDNVTLAPGADIPFYQGQLFIYNSVHFTGTSALVYSSPQSSFIMPSASLYFDTSTTFSFAPATASKNQIIMSSGTSSLVLNGCSFKVTDTGIRLTVGALTYQDSVVLDSKNGYSLSSLTTATSGYFFGGYTSAAVTAKIRWHPSGRYFACTADQTAGPAKVYAFNPVTDTTTEVCSASYGTAAYYPYAVDWSPDGRFLALGGAYAGSVVLSPLKIFLFNGSSLTLVTSVTLSYWTYSLAWSPDGHYLAIGGSGGTPSFEVYRFNGITLTLVTLAEVNQIINNVRWHPSGAYITIQYQGTPFQTWIYSFNGSTLAPVSNAQFGSAAYCSDFSPDGKYIVASSGAGDVLVYNVPSFSGISSRNYGEGAVRSVKWSPDGKILAVVGDQGVVRTFLFTGSAEEPSVDCSLSPVPTSILDCAWHPSGQYLGAIGKDATNFYYYILRAGYVAPPSQAQTNSVVYGNAALGSGANLSVGGSPSTLRGYVRNENVT